MTEVPDHWVEKLTEVLSRLEQVVVSLDRIGSREATGDAGPEVVNDFINRWDIARSLAKARRHVYDLLEETVDLDTLSEDEDVVDRLDLLDLPIWPEGPG